jgi:sugar lactone lactonase YvrE
MRVIAPRLFSLLLITPFVALLTSCSSYGLRGISLTGSKATPQIVWPTPAPITSPAPLTSAQLDATANVPGAFVYSPAMGAVLPAGTQTLTTTFTPTDTARYNTTKASVKIVVNAQAGGPPPTSLNDHLIVADTENNRILIYEPPIETNAAASVVLGQASFGTKSESPWWSTPETLFGPWAMTLDSTGNLWVADTYDCRVVEFQPPFTTNMSASLVLGQPGLSVPVEWPDCFTSGASGMNGPFSVAFDSKGDLWVADTFAGRVTEYVPPFTNGMAVAVSIGQANLSDQYECNGQVFQPAPGSWSPGAATARSLCEPLTVAFDQKGDLWVTDTGNHRILEFVPPLSTGMSASLEISGPDVNADGSCNDDDPSCLSPTAMSFDSQGNLWVADTGGKQVLEFVPPFANGMAASMTLKQPGATNQPDAVPLGISFDRTGNLFVAYDSSQILIFTPPFSNAMSAAFVIGPTAMKDGLCASPTSETLCLPQGVLAY